MAEDRFPENDASSDVGCAVGGGADVGAVEPGASAGAAKHDANATRHDADAAGCAAESDAHAGKMSRKKIAAIVAGVVAVLAVVAGVAAALWFAAVSSDLNCGDKSDAELSELDDLLAKTTFDEPFYVMLLGSDARADDASMGARSDTNIVVRVDPTKNQLTLVSIPRDTMIKIDGHGTNKFNAAYSFKGAPGAIEEANKLLGVEISHYVEVNFEELTALVDAVGGVDIEVESTINDPKAGDVVVEKGLQHLDGEAALVYARTRQYADGDFTRTAHQRTLVSALAAKVLSLSPVEMPGVIQSAAKCVTTDLTVTEIMALAQQFQDGGELTVYSAMVPSTTGMVGGISYVFADEDALAEMMKVVEQGGDPTGFVASASAASKALAKYGVAAEVTDVGSAVSDDDEPQGSGVEGSAGSGDNTGAEGAGAASGDANGSNGSGANGSNEGDGDADGGDSGSAGSGGSGSSDSGGTTDGSGDSGSSGGSGSSSSAGGTDADGGAAPSGDVQ